MHDYYAAKALLEHLTSLDDLRVEDVAEVRIRAAATLSPESLLQAYEMLTQATALEGSRLVVEELPADRRCSACGTSRTLTRGDLAGHVLICPTCGAQASIEGNTAIELVGIVGGRAARSVRNREGGPAGPPSSGGGVIRTRERRSSP